MAIYICSKSLVWHLLNYEWLVGTCKEVLYFRPKGGELYRFCWWFISDINPLRVSLISQCIIHHISRPHEIWQLPASSVRIWVLYYYIRSYNEAGLGLWHFHAFIRMTHKEWQNRCVNWYFYMYIDVPANYHCLSTACFKIFFKKSVGTTLKLKAGKYSLIVWPVYMTMTIVVQIVFK